MNNTEILVVLIALVVAGLSIWVLLPIYRNLRAQNKKIDPKKQKAILLFEKETRQLFTAHGWIQNCASGNEVLLTLTAQGKSDRHYALASAMKDLNLDRINFKVLKTETIPLLLRQMIEEDLFLLY